MAVTVFADVVFPSSIIASDRPRGKNMRRNSVVETDNGQQSVNIVWTQTLREYELATVPLLVAQWQEIERLFEITEGGAYGFLFQDPKDRHVSTDGVLTRLSAGVFQLVKRYLDPVSTRTKDRRITRPVEAGFVLSQSGIAMTSGYTLDVLTGQVSIPADPDPATLTWSGDFYVPVRFMNDYIEWELEKSGSFDGRYAAGPSVVLQEVRE